MAFDFLSLSSLCSPVEYVKVKFIHDGTANNGNLTSKKGTMAENFLGKN